MTKKEIKQILFSLQDNTNYEAVTYLLGKIDMLDEKQIAQLYTQEGRANENIEQYLKEAIENILETKRAEPKRINRMFTYHVSGKTIVLHLPEDLRQMLEKYEYKKTMRMVNWYLLDAIDKLVELQSHHYKPLIEAEDFYMVSPILIDKELKYLRELGFTTNKFFRRDLLNHEFIESEPEAKLAVKICGTDRNVSAARISLAIVKTQEYQTIKKRKMSFIEKSGIKVAKTRS